MIDQLVPYDQKSFGDDCLDMIVEWVGANLDPGQVFDIETMTEWFEDEGYTVEEA